MKKKIAITLISLVAVLVMAFSFAACGVAGTYKLEELSVTYNGEVLTAKAGEDLVFVEKIGETTSTMATTIDAKSCVLTLNRDGTYSVTMSLPVYFNGTLRTETKHDEGKWEEQDGKINILDDNGKVTQTFTVEDNRIVWEIEGFYKIVLKK